MTRFVRCIDNTLAADFLTVGRVYEVLGVNQRGWLLRAVARSVHHDEVRARLRHGGGLRLRPEGGHNGQLGRCVNSDAALPPSNGAVSPPYPARRPDEWGFSCMAADQLRRFLAFFFLGAFFTAFFSGDFFAAFFGITFWATFLTFFTAVLAASFVACAASATMSVICSSTGFSSSISTLLE
jgi:hypothetical protein